MIERLDRLGDHIEIQRMLQRAWHASTLESVQPSIERVEGRLASGVGQALALYDADHIARGILLWYWYDQAHMYAQGTTLYTENYAADGLVDELFEAGLAEPSLKAISVAVRGDSPGARDALLRRDAVFFGRCEMVCDLNGSLAESPLADGYHLVQWTDEVNPAVETVGLAALAGTIDEVAVPDTMPEQFIEVLRQLRANEYPGLMGWNDAASGVILDGEGRAAGYIGICTAGGMGFVADIAVHPAHQRRGLGRAMMMHSMRMCREQHYTQMGLAVTTRNPAQHLYEALGFRVVECGETAIWWRDGRQVAWRETK
ncbi:MAG TPA: GNAT family N-acetyltransferase [Aggregatilineaceae bacterium]|nr:GNAT family N-acetyltransferase [Aggregatilineaceae bacterium]